jgi:hypothetical protein
MKTSEKVKTSKTSDTVHELGVYSSACCNIEATFDTGDTFSRCPQCQHLCVWELDDEYVAPNGHNEPGSGIAA